MKLPLRNSGQVRIKSGIDSRLQEEKGLKTSQQAAVGPFGTTLSSQNKAGITFCSATRQARQDVADVAG